MKLPHSTYPHTGAGFGIIEVMIALALGVIIMLGVTQIATNNSNTRYELERAGRQMENAAFALREIENDLANAGYWGEMSTVDIDSFPPVCPDDAGELQRSMAYPVQGYQEFEPLGSNAFDCDNLGAITPSAGTDFIAIRRASSCPVDDPDYPDCAPAGTNFHLQVHSCANDGTAAGTFEVSNDLTDFAYTERDCVTDAPIYRMLNRIYYVKNDQLMRAELVGSDYTETAIVDGVEAMRLEYGMDRDGDGQVDAADGITLDPTDDPTSPGTPKPVDWANVVMVRISLVVRSTDTGESKGQSASFTDTKDYVVAGEDYSVPAGFENYRRQVYSRTVGLRNVAGRREEAP